MMLEEREEVCEGFMFLRVEESVLSIRMICKI